MGGGKWGKGGGKGGKGGKGGGKKKKSKSRKSLNFRSVPTTDDASVHAAVDAAGPAAAAPRSGKDLWSLDSVEKLVPPPKKPSLMYRLYKSAKRAAGFKSTKKGLALDEEEEEEDDDPGVKPSSSATAPTTTATATATAATTTTAGSPLANDARLVNPFASLGKLDPSSPVPVPVSGSPPRPPGSLPSGESGGGGAPRARIAHPAEANAAERGETRKTFSVYSAYKGLRRRVRGDFSDFGKMTKTCRAADPHPSRAFDANETSTTNVDDAFAALDAAARKGRPPPGTLDPSNPVPAPVSRDVRVGTREFPGISSSGSEPASSESTASRAYREALRVMLPPDARARAAAREPTFGTTGTIAPGSASARSHPRVSPGFPRRSFDATSSAGHISGTATGTHHTKTSSRNVSRSDASPSPGTSSTKTSPSPSGEPARDAGSSSALARADAIVRAAAAERVADTPRGRFRAATRALIGDMRRRSDAVAGVARGALEVFDTLLALEPAAASLGRVQRRVDPAFWARVPPPPPRPPRASLRVAASDPRCVSRPRLDARKSVRFRAVQAAAKRGTSDSRLGEDGRTENVSAENVSANVEDSLPDRPAPRASGSPGGRPASSSTTLAARGTLTSSSPSTSSSSSPDASPAPRTWVSGRGGSVAGDHLARSPATMAAARARAAAMVKRTNRAGRSRFATLSDSESDGDDDEDDGSSSSDERFESRLFLRSLRPANGASDLENLRAVRREMLARRAEASPSTVVPVSSDVWTELAKLGGFESFDDVPTAAEAAAGLSASVSAVARAGGDVASATREVSRARVRAAYAADAARKRADAPTRPHAAAVGSGFGSPPTSLARRREEYREARAKQAGYGERR